MKKTLLFIGALLIIAGGIIATMHFMKPKPTIYITLTVEQSSTELAKIYSELKSKNIDGVYYVVDDTKFSYTLEDMLEIIETYINMSVLGEKFKETDSDEAKLQLLKDDIKRMERIEKYGI